jgi:hypothetical protein
MLNEKAEPLSRIRKKARLSTPDTPAFRTWFGDSKVVDRQRRPLVCYHGTFNDFHAFDPTLGHTGLIFFSANPRMANGYATSRKDWEGNLAAGAKLIPVYIRMIKPYDYRVADNQAIADEFYANYGELSGDDAHAIRVALYGRHDVEDHQNPKITDETLDVDEFITALDQGMYPALELHEFLEFLQRRGFDGIVTHEVRSINFGVFNANQVKSVFAKEFNPDSDHLSETSTSLNAQSDFRRWMMLCEAKSAPLYHATGFFAAMLILNRENFEASDNSMDRDDAFNISTTRDPRLRYYQVEGVDAFGHAPIQFVLNQETVSSRHKMAPSDAAADHDEQEEKIYANQVSVSHVTEIQFYSVPNDFVPNDQDAYFLKELGGRNAAYARIASLAANLDIPVKDMRRKASRTIMKSHVQSRSKR